MSSLQHFQGMGSVLSGVRARGPWSSHAVWTKRTPLGREEILGAQGRDSGLNRAEKQAPRLQGQGAGSGYRLIQQPSAACMLAAGM